ncbi:hypothetical protein [Leucobacter sp. M11]|uniref:hypothetical protein n=1 Tax=Leucobacter sp. M11 TaxID=2993565 RepID=UPI002D7ED1BB|nr:hypothetical protein [Leucobacter sp. M11]MEB4614398.1 hypothetical protein [Leucobacter sp. M11]
MSSLREPVGPEQKRVYLRRRLVVLAGLLAIVLAIVLIVVKVSAGGAPADEKEPVALPEGVAESPNGGGKTKSDAPKGDGSQECAAGNVAVTPITDQQSYASGEQPQFSLSVELTADEPCTIDLGTEGMVFRVLSGTEQYWISTDCQTSPDSRPVILQPGEALTTEPFSWERTRSSPDTCSSERDPVPDGGVSYHLTATAGGVESRATAQFILN